MFSMQFQQRVAERLVFRDCSHWLHCIHHRKHVWCVVSRRPNWPHWDWHVALGNPFPCDMFHNTCTRWNGSITINSPWLSYRMRWWVARRTGVTSTFGCALSVSHLIFLGLVSCQYEFRESSQSSFYATTGLSMPYLFDVVQSLDSALLLFGPFSFRFSFYSPFSWCHIGSDYLLDEADI